MVCRALAALCCGLATACDLPRPSNRPLSWHTVLGVLDSQLPLLLCVLGMSAQTIRTCLENHQGLNRKCVPFGLTKWAFVIFHNPSEHRQTQRSICLQCKNLTHGYTWGNRNFLCEEKYLMQSTAASFAEIEKDTWQFKWNQSYICTGHQRPFYYSFL